MKIKIERFLAFEILKALAVRRAGDLDLDRDHLQNVKSRRLDNCRKKEKSGRKVYKFSAFLFCKNYKSRRKITGSFNFSFSSSPFSLAKPH